MKTVLLFGLFFCHHLQEDDRLNQADEYFNATLYDKAIPLYQEFQENPHAALKLAQAYCAQKQFQEAIPLLEKINTPESSYFLGLSYQQTGLFVQAIEAYKKALDSPYSQKAILELGCVYFLLDQKDLARDQFQKIEEKLPLAQIYLARLDLLEKQENSAEKRLKELHKKVEKQELLYFEIAYWRGLAHYQLGDFSTAAEFFTIALPKRHQEKAPWLSDTLHLLVSSYLKMSFYDKAEQLLVHLRQEAPNEEQEVELAHLYLQKGKELKDKENKQAESLRLFQLAADAFEQAYKYLKGFDNPRASLAVKFQAEALWHQGSIHSAQKALEVLSNSEILHFLVHPDEIYYLRGLISAHVGKKIGEESTLTSAENILNEGLTLYPMGSYREKILFLLGTLNFQKKSYLAAVEQFIKLTEKGDSPLAGEAFFWAAKSLEAADPTNERISLYREKVFKDFPSSSHAAEAYFSYYPYREYLQGNRAAIKHLQGFADKFPDSPYLINVNYLLGMDFKRDRRSPEGKWIRRRDMNSSIEYFQQAESNFDKLFLENKIPQEELDYFIKMRFRITLERALANLAIANASQGAKRQIFLEYAEEVFTQMIDDLQDAKHPLAEREPFPSLLEESLYWLGQTYVQEDQDSQARKIYLDMLDKYKAAKITRGYYLSRVLYELGVLHLRNHDPKVAIDYLISAEDASKGKVLSTDQKIDLWIQQSLAYQNLKETDKAMLILSKAINHDEISSLRIKAMYLRAEIYAQQGRHDLARKQLEALSKKGGEWALKARQKLDFDYGYQ